MRSFISLRFQIRVTSAGMGIGMLKTRPHGVPGKRCRILRDADVYVRVCFSSVVCVTTLSSLHILSSDGRISVNDELRTMWKEARVACLRHRSQNLCGESHVNHVWPEVRIRCFWVENGTGGLPVSTQRWWWQYIEVLLSAGVASVY
jgi:hypothetical protein